MNTKISNTSQADQAALNDILLKSKAHWGYSHDFLSKYMSNYGISESTYKNALLTGDYIVSQNKENQVELDHFFIDPAHIRKGLGLRMRHDLLENLSTCKVSHFIIWSDPNSLGFYEKLGCVIKSYRDSPLAKNRRLPVLEYLMSDSIL